MSDVITFKTLAKIAFKNKEEFISAFQGKDKPEVMELGLKLWFSPKGRKFGDEELWERKKRILRQVNRMNWETGYGKSSIKLKEQTLTRIGQLVEESGFTKNRKQKFRVFLNEMATWQQYIKKLPFEQLRAMEAIYWEFSVHVFHNLVPLPSVLLGRWVSGDIPARKPVERFEKDIIEKIKNESDKELLINAYYLDCTGKRYVLKKSVDDEEKQVIKKVLDSIGYSNKSGTKYVDFMKYLIKKEVLELKVSYSTHGKCNYYKINL